MPTSPQKPSTALWASIGNCERAPSRSISPGGAKLPHDPVERRRASLRPADVVLTLGRVPEQFQRPSVGAMVKQAAQREPHLDGVDAHLRGASHGRSQNTHGEFDDEALMARQLGGHLVEVPGFDPDYVLGFASIAMCRPVEISRLRVPAPFTAIR